MTFEGAKPIVSIVEHDGSLIYTDDQGREAVRAVGFVAIAMFVGRQGEQPLMTCWRTAGVFGVVAEVIAQMCAAEPGLKEAIDGMYVMCQKRKEREGRP